MIGGVGRVLTVALVASFALCPAPSIAAAAPGWNVVEATDGGTCGASTDGAVLIATPDGARFGIIVSNVTLGERSEREIQFDGAPISFKWTQLRTTAFTPLDDQMLAKIASARTVEFQWPERQISLRTDGLSSALTKLKACGEAIHTRRLAAATSAAKPADAGPAPSAEGPLVLTLECEGQGVWMAEGSVSSGIPGDVMHDKSVAYRAGGQGRVRLHFGPDGNTASFPATFPYSVSLRPVRMSNVEVGPDRIVGRARGLLGLATMLSVDRRTGDVNFDFAGVKFSGACRKVDEAAARKF